jgi:hypothetical protein
MPAERQIRNENPIFDVVALRSDTAVQAIAVVLVQDSRHTVVLLLYSATKTVISTAEEDDPRRVRKI